MSTRERGTTDAESLTQIDLTRVTQLAQSAIDPATISRIANEMFRALPGLSATPLRDAGSLGLPASAAAPVGVMPISGGIPELSQLGGVPSGGVPSGGMPTGGMPSGGMPSALPSSAGFPIPGGMQTSDRKSVV